ncbi:MAG TPA: sodium:solute symporter family protein [Vicinamibacterales bacterium]|nr:sodium:solute symporter family protein [Vicinamibacterales bacterium]
MNLHLAVLSVYSLGLMALGLWIGRRVRGASDFFVAGRRLGPGLIFSTMLAANIGAGSTVNATGLGYSQGLAAWWWVGSAAIGSTALAFWIGPAIRRAAAAHDLRTVGDYLEFRYSQTVRGVVSTLLWFGSIAILAGQLIAIGTILNVVAAIPFAWGCAIGGAVITVYFTAGGLLTSAWVNVVQLTVKMLGFAVALPLAISAAGGWSGVTSVRGNDMAYWTFARGDLALAYFVAIAPAFVVSPGLLQKIFGARDDRAVRVGVGLNALGLFVYAIVPALLGIAARGLFGTLADPQQALPLILIRALPPIVGAIGLAAVFSAEISAADASLFMLTTSLSQDLYKRFIAPDASDDTVLRVARWTAFVSGIFGIALAVASASIVQVLTIFYTLLSVSLFVPIVAGLFVPSASTRDALAAISAGVAVMLMIQVSTGGRGYGLVTPALGGLAAAIIVWGVSHALVSHRRHRG